jgi:hypothetical protein
MEGLKKPRRFKARAALQVVFVGFCTIPPLLGFAWRPHSGEFKASHFPVKLAEAVHTPANFAEDSHLLLRTTGLVQIPESDRELIMRLAVKRIGANRRV